MTQRNNPSAQPSPEAMTEGKHGNAQEEHEAAEHAHKGNENRARELAVLRQRTAAAEEEAQRLRRSSLLKLHDLSASNLPSKGSCMHCSLMLRELLRIARKVDVCCSIPKTHLACVT